MSKGGQGKANQLPERTEWIWHNGEIIPWDAAQLHVMSHVVHYGSSVFEGIRFYDTPNGPAAFRLTDHMRRFLNSARIYRMDRSMPGSRESKRLGVGISSPGGPPGPGGARTPSW